MSPAEHVPSDEDMRHRHSLGVLSDGTKRVFLKHQNEWDRWLAAHDARVRRDAARGALDGLAKHATALAEGGRVGSFRNHWWTVAGLAEGYRDVHYPEETP